MNIDSKYGIRQHLLTLCTGTVVAQLISLAFYPILGRLFTPEDFGLLATISSIVSFITILGTGKYEQAILIAENRRNAAALVILSLICSLSVGAIILVLFSINIDEISFWLNEPKLKSWLLFIPLLSILITIYNCYNEWCVKNAQFYKLSLNKISNSVFSVLPKFIYGLKSISYGLIYGELIGRLLTAIVCVIRIFIFDWHHFRKVTIFDIKRMALYYQKFPLFILPDQLLNTAGLIMPTIFITVCYGAMELGYYSMMQNVMAIPMVFIGQAVMDVFRKHANNDFYINGNCSAIFNITLKYLLVISISALVILIVPLPYIFKIVLGEQWYISGELAQLYAPATALGFICNSLSGVWIITEKLKYRFYWQLYYVCIVIISLFLGYFIVDTVKGIVFFLSLGLSSAYIVSIYFSWKYSKGI